jgi:hypothetical protein
MDEGLAIECRQCGAPVAFVLRAPVPPCVHCKTPEPLDVATRARVDGAAAVVSRAAAREQAAQLKRADEIASLMWMVPALAIPCWLIFGGIALSLIWDALPSDGTIAFLARSVSGSDAATAWWVLYLAITGIAATLAGYFVCSWLLRRQLVLPRAVAPLSPGAPPRCHLCGGGLRGAGPRRGCPYCGASNLVDDAAFRQAADGLLAQLRAAEAGELARIATVGHGMDAVMKATVALPFVLIAAVPIGSLFGASLPKLWWVALALFALAVVFFVMTLTRSPPEVPTLRGAKPGDIVRVRGVAHAVVGTSDHHPPRALLAPAGSSTPTLAIDAYANQGHMHVNACTIAADGTRTETEIDPDDIVVVQRQS